MDTILIQALLACIAFGFALFLAHRVRLIERFGREPWWQVLFAFVIGAGVTVIGSVGLSFILIAPVQGFGDCIPFDMTMDGIFAAVIVAPFAEELMKMIGVLAMSSWIREVEDGIVYGTAVGLGFAATENVLYFTAALATAGITGAFATVVVRSLTSTFLHLGATGLTGFGLGLHFTGGNRGWPWWIFLLMAMLVHAVFNLSASIQLLAGDHTARIVLALAGLSLGVFITWTLFFWLQRLIRELDLRRSSV